MTREPSTSTLEVALATGGDHITLFHGVFVEMTQRSHGGDFGPNDRIKHIPKGSPEHTEFWYDGSWQETWRFRSAWWSNAGNEWIGPFNTRALALQHFGDGSDAEEPDGGLTPLEVMVDNMRYSSEMALQHAYASAAADRMPPGALRRAAGPSWPRGWWLGPSVVLGAALWGLAAAWALKHLGWL